MTKGELKQLLDELPIDDDTPVVVMGESLKGWDADVSIGVIKLDDQGFYASVTRNQTIKSTSDHKGRVLALIFG